MLCRCRATQCSSIAMSAALCLGNALPHEPLPWRCRAKLSRAVPQLCGSEQRPCGAYPVHAVAVRVASVLCRRSTMFCFANALTCPALPSQIGAGPCPRLAFPRLAVAALVVTEHFRCSTLLYLAVAVRYLARPCHASAVPIHPMLIHRYAFPIRAFLCHCLAVLRISIAIAGLSRSLPLQSRPFRHLAVPLRLIALRCIAPRRFAVALHLT